MAALEIYSERVLVLRLVELKGDVGESIVVIAFVEGEMIVIMKGLLLYHLKPLLGTTLIQRG